MVPEKVVVQRQVDGQRLTWYMISSADSRSYGANKKHIVDAQNKNKYKITNNRKTWLCMTWLPVNVQTGHCSLHCYTVFEILLQTEDATCSADTVIYHANT